MCLSVDAELSICVVGCFWDWNWVRVSKDICRYVEDPCLLAMLFYNVVWDVWVVLELRGQNSAIACASRPSKEGGLVPGRLSGGESFPICKFLTFFWDYGGRRSSPWNSCSFEFDNLMFLPCGRRRSLYTRIIFLFFFNLLILNLYYAVFVSSNNKHCLMITGNGSIFY